MNTNTCGEKLINSYKFGTLTDKVCIFMILITNSGRLHHVQDVNVLLNAKHIYFYQYSLCPNF